MMQPRLLASAGAAACRQLHTLVIRPLALHFATASCKAADHA